MGYKLASVKIDWIHYRAKSHKAVDIDIQGYHEKNGRVYWRRWGAYIRQRRFGKTRVIKRNASLGDVFLTTPILKALRKKYPGDELLLMTSCPQMMMESSLVDGLIRWGVPFECDELIDLDYAYEKNFNVHIVEAYRRVAGVGPVPRRAIMEVTKETYDRIRAEVINIDKYVAIDLSDSWDGKMWHHYDQIIPQIKKSGLKVVGIGKRTKNPDRVLPETDYSFVDKFSPLETGVVIAGATMFIGHEGLTAHIAQATFVPSIVFYGCTNPKYVADLTFKYLRPIVSPAACQGCRHMYCAGTGIICNREFVCMEMITPEMVTNAYEGLLDDIIKEKYGNPQAEFVGK